MKIKPSRRPGHVTMDVSGRDLRLLAAQNPPRGRDSTKTKVATDDYTHLDERANAHTSLLEEILGRTVCAR